MKICKMQAEKILKKSVDFKEKVCASDRGKRESSAAAAASVRCRSKQKSNCVGATRRGRGQSSLTKKGGRAETVGGGDMKAKLERSRQSARECRARKKLRYHYLEELVTHREEAVLMLRQELETYKKWCREIDDGHIPEELKKRLAAEAAEESGSTVKDSH